MKSIPLFFFLFKHICHAFAFHVLFATPPMMIDLVDTRKVSFLSLTINLLISL